MPASHRPAPARYRRRRSPPPASLVSKLLTALSPSSIFSFLLFAAFVTLHVGYQVYLLLLRLITWRYTEPTDVALLSSLRIASASSSSKRSIQGLTTTEVTLPGSTRSVSYRIPSHLAVVLAPPPQARLRHLIVPPVLAAAASSSAQHLQSQSRLDADLVIQLRELIRWSSIVRIDTLSALDPKGRLKELLAERFGSGEGAEWIIEWESKERWAPVTGSEAVTAANDAASTSGAASRLLKRPSFHRFSTALEHDDDDDDLLPSGRSTPSLDGRDIFMTPSLDSVASFHTPLLDSPHVSSLRGQAEEEEELDSGSTTSSSSMGSAESLLAKEGSGGSDLRSGRRRDQTIRSSTSSEGMRSPTSNSATSPASSRSPSRSRPAKAEEANMDRGGQGAAGSLWERLTSRGERRWWMSGRAAGEATSAGEDKRTRWRVRARLHLPPSSSSSSSTAPQPLEAAPSPSPAVLPLAPVDEEMSIDVWLFGPEDGKGMMRDVGQALLEERRRGEACKIDVGAVDGRLRTLAHLPPSDPELLLLHGGTRDVQSLTGYPSWALRLTEIFYDERADMRRGVELRSFLGALRRFARAEQRFGK